MSMIKNCFGGKDEQAMTDNFEELCGGVTKAQRLFFLWKHSDATGTKFDMLYGVGLTKSQVFERHAKREGFTDKQIDAFYNLC